MCVICVICVILRFCCSFFFFPIIFLKLFTKKKIYFQHSLLHSALERIGRENFGERDDDTEGEEGSHPSPRPDADVDNDMRLPKMQNANATKNK